LLGLIMTRQTLQQPFRHLAFLAAIMVSVTLVGWGLGLIIRFLVPGSGLTKFVVECTTWILFVAVLASLIARTDFRNRLIAAIPR
jgi:hypothetical protein